MSTEPTAPLPGRPPLSSSDLLAAVVDKAKSEGRECLWCSDFSDVEGWPGCCVSCHEDNNEHGYDLCSGELFGMPMEVCCAIISWLDKQQAANARGEQPAPTAKKEKK